MNGRRREREKCKRGKREGEEGGRRRRKEERKRTQQVPER